MATKRDELIAWFANTSDEELQRIGLAGASAVMDGKEPKGCLASAHEHEPLFILRAQDAFSTDTVRAWVDFCIAAGMEHNHPKALEALAWCDQAEAWQVEHGSKVPD